MKKITITFVGKYFGQRINFKLNVTDQQAERLQRGDYYTPNDIYEGMFSDSQRRRYDNGLQGDADYYSHYEVQ